MPGRLLRMRPSLYWHLLGDWLIGHIHQRVLAHVEQPAEG